MVSTGLCAAAALIGGVLPYIKLLYPLPQYVNEAEVIVEGVIESADPQTKTCVVKLTKFHKGKCPYTHIRMNIAVGGNWAGGEWHRDAAMKHYVVGARAVLFYKNDTYRKETWRGQIYISRFFASLHVKKNDPPATALWEWENLEIHLNRSFNRTAEELAALVAGILLGKQRPPAPDPNVPQINKDDVLALPPPGVKVDEAKLPPPFRRSTP